MYFSTFGISPRVVASFESAASAFGDALSFFSTSLSAFASITQIINRMTINQMCENVCCSGMLTKNGAPLKRGNFVCIHSLQHALVPAFQWHCLFVQNAAAGEHRYACIYCYVWSATVLIQTCFICFSVLDIVPLFAGIILTFLRSIGGFLLHLHFSEAKNWKDFIS